MLCFSVSILAQYRTVKGRCVMKPTNVSVRVSYPVRATIRGLLRTAAYAKEPRQFPLYRECVFELRETIKKRERVVS